jgi:hypothetical protein
MRTPTSRNDDLAAELLDVVNPSELDRFLGRLVAEAARDAGRRLPADTGRALVGALGRTAERTLPTLTLAVGDARRPAPANAAETAARVFGMELEGMSAEDRDFEIARRLVHLARAATERAATSSAPDPVTAARNAVAQAGWRLAPGLAPPRPGAAPAP